MVNTHKDLLMHKDILPDAQRPRSWCTKISFLVHKDLLFLMVMPVCVQRFIKFHVGIAKPVVRRKLWRSHTVHTLEMLSRLWDYLRQWMKVQGKSKVIGQFAYRRTCNYWIALGGKTSVYSGTQGWRRCACGPNENLKEWLSSCTYYLASLVIFDLMVSTNHEISVQIVVIPY